VTRRLLFAIVRLATLLSVVLFSVRRNSARLREWPGLKHAVRCWAALDMFLSFSFVWAFCLARARDVHRSPSVILITCDVKSA
jgi:hypothetical protein